VTQISFLCFDYFAKKKQTKSDEVYYTDGYDVIKTNPPGPDGRYLQYRFEISRRNNAPWFKSTKTILPHRPGEENEVAEDEDIRDVIAATTVIGMCFDFFDFSKIETLNLRFFHFFVFVFNEFE